MQNYSWSKLKSPVVVFLLLLTSVGLVWFGVNVLRGKIQAKMDQLQEIEVLSEYRSAQVGRLPLLKEKNAFIFENQEMLNIILTKDQLVKFIETLEKIGVDLGVEVKIVSQDNAFLESKVTVETPKPAGSSTVSNSTVPSSVGGDDKLPKKKETKKAPSILDDASLPVYLRLTITVTGSYAATLEYLHKMETLPYALDVIGVRVGEHLEADERPSVGVGVNQYNPDGTLRPPVVVVKPFRLETVFDTVVYLRSK